MVELIGGQAHAKDSNELAFCMAAIFAVKDALRQARAILLEPIMALECVASDAYRGGLLDDLNWRHGRIVGVEEQVKGDRQRGGYSPGRGTAGRTLRLRQRDPFVEPGPRLVFDAPCTLRAGAYPGKLNETENRAGKLRYAARFVFVSAGADATLRKYRRGIPDRLPWIGTELPSY